MIEGQEQVFSEFAAEMYALGQYNMTEISKAWIGRQERIEAVKK